MLFYITRARREILDWDVWLANDVICKGVFPLGEKGLEFSGCGQALDFRMIGYIQLLQFNFFNHS